MHEKVGIQEGVYSAAFAVTDGHTQPAVLLHGLHQEPVVVAVTENRYIGRLEVFQIISLLDILVVGGQDVDGER